jgi:hypothetical protein
LEKRLKTAKSSEKIGNAGEFKSKNSKGGTKVKKRKNNNNKNIFCFGPKAME